MHDDSRYRIDKDSEAYKRGSSGGSGDPGNLSYEAGQNERRRNQNSNGAGGAGGGAAILGLAILAAVGLISNVAVLGAYLIRRGAEALGVAGPFSSWRLYGASFTALGVFAIGLAAPSWGLDFPRRTLVMTFDHLILIPDFTTTDWWSSSHLMTVAICLVAGILGSGLAIRMILAPAFSGAGGYQKACVVAGAVGAVIFLLLTLPKHLHSFSGIGLMAYSVILTFPGAWIIRLCGGVSDVKGVEEPMQQAVAASFSGLSIGGLVAVPLHGSSAFLAHLFGFATLVAVVHFNTMASESKRLWSSVVAGVVLWLPMPLLFMALEA